jgi:hypothetical protein
MLWSGTYAFSLLVPEKLRSAESTQLPVPRNNATSIGEQSLMDVLTTEVEMFEIVLAGALFALFVAVWVWQNPGMIRGRLQAQEITQYMAQIEKLPFPLDGRAEGLQRLRAWLESDDGQPCYMLNLMRYYPELHRLPGGPNYKGTPQESNARYETAATSMLLKLGGYPVYAGTPQGRNIIEHDPALDNWSRLLVVRYPSRRAFAKLLTHPGYPEIEPYKLMAVQLVLTPTTAEVVIPNIPLLVGGVLLVVFLAVGWARATGAF